MELLPGLRKIPGGLYFSANSSYDPWVGREDSAPDLEVSMSKAVTLEEALAEIGREEDKREAAGAIVFRLTKDPAHWLEYGIDTAQKLWDYLDACCERECRKSEMFGGDDDVFDPDQEWRNYQAGMYQ